MHSPDCERRVLCSGARLAVERLLFSDEEKDFYDALRLRSKVHLGVPSQPGITSPPAPDRAASRDRLPYLAGAIYLRDVSALPFRPSHSAVMPSMVYSPSPSSSMPHSMLLAKLPKQGMCGPFQPTSVSGW